MTLLELQKQVDRLVKHGYGDKEVVVSTYGIGGACESVKSVTTGIDWNQNHILINTQTRLSHIQPRDHEYLFREYLKKISNFHKVSCGLTLTARYKKEEKTFEKKFQAELWLWDKLREEIKNRK